jgi:hypothetical protein
MEYIKNIPNWLAQSIFVDMSNNDVKIVEMKGNQIDLFFALIFLTSNSYDYNKDTPRKTTYTYTKKKLEVAYKKSSTLDKDMEKLNGLEIISNVLCSYDDKEWKYFTPFLIKKGKIIKDKKSIIKFTVTVEEKFIKEFSNPNPKFTLSYEYLTSFSNPQAKILYMILFDHLGMVSHKFKTKKSRIIELDILKFLFNRNSDWTFTQLARDIDSSIKYINENTDLEIIKHYDTYDVEANGDDIIKHKFTMIRTKEYQLYVKNSNKVENDETKTETTKSNSEKAKKIMEEAIAKGVAIENQEAYLRTVCKNLVEEQKEEATNKEYQYDIDTWIIGEMDEYVKDDIEQIYAKKKKIPMLGIKALRQGDIVYFIDDNYNIVNVHKEMITTNCEETFNTLVKWGSDNTLEAFIFEADGTSNIKSCFIDEDRLRLNGRIA